MKNLKTFEEYVGVEYVPYKPQHKSYKNEEKNKNKKKKG